MHVPYKQDNVMWICFVQGCLQEIPDRCAFYTTVLDKKHNFKSRKGLARKMRLSLVQQTL